MKKLSCEYCGEKFDGKLRRCPHCGGMNKLAFQYEQNEAREAAAEKAARGEDGAAAAPQATEPKQGVRKPKTIEELKLFAAEHDLPLRDMRVHLGEDYDGAKAYGIYRAEDGSFVVYKNKADGSRSVRYQGPDEAYAVNELFLKMKERIARQPARQAARLGRRSRGGNAEVPGPRPWLEVVKQNAWKYVLILVVCTVIWLVIKQIGRQNPKPSQGYYHYNDRYYFYQNDRWYGYYDDWIPVSVDSGLAEDAIEYYLSDSYSNSYGVEDFADSSFYANSGGSAWNNGNGYWGDNGNDDWNDNGNGYWDNGNDDWNDNGNGYWDNGNDDWNDNGNGYWDNGNDWDNDDWDNDDWDWDNDWDWDDDDDWDDDWGWDDDWDSDW